MKNLDRIDGDQLHFRQSEKLIPDLMSHLVSDRYQLH